MSDADGWLSDAVESGENAVREFASFLGVRQEKHVCPDCNEACEKATTYNPDTAAFDGGACPSWYCSECDSHFVREADDDSHTMDLYGRGMD